jgi:hypothetical protein
MFRVLEVLKLVLWYRAKLRAKNGKVIKEFQHSEFAGG